MGRRISTPATWAAASVVLVVAAPVVVHFLLAAAHARSYAGVCGPHAPDIAAHPCSYEEYVAEFGAGFAGVGLLLVEAGVLVVTGTIVAAGWAIWALVRWRRRKKA